MVINIDDDQVTKGPIVISDDSSDDDNGDLVLATYKAAASKRNEDEAPEINEEEEEELRQHNHIHDHNTRSRRSSDRHKPLKRNGTQDRLTSPSSPPSRPTPTKKDKHDKSKILAQLLTEKTKNDELRAGADGQEDAYRRFLEKERQLNEKINNPAPEVQQEEDDASSSDDDEFLTFDRDVGEVDENNENSDGNANTDNALGSVLNADKLNIKKEKVEKQYKPNYNFFDMARYQDPDTKKAIEVSLETVLTDDEMPALQKDCLVEYARVRSEDNLDNEHVYISVVMPTIIARSDPALSFIHFVFQLMILHEYIPIKDAALRILQDDLPRYNRDTVPFGLADLLPPLTLLGMSPTTENLLHGKNERMVLKPVTKDDKKELIGQSAKRITILSRLISLMHSLSLHSLFDIGDTSGLFTMMILLSMDRSVSSIYHQIAACANSALNSIGGGESGVLEDTNKIDLHILSQILNAAFGECSAYQLNMLAVFPSGTLRAMRMRRWLAWAILLEGKKEPIDSHKYMKPPNIRPLITQLRGMDSASDSKFSINEHTNYDDLTNCVEILSIVLTDIESYLNAERHLITFEPNEKDRDQNSIADLYQLLRSLSGMIVDTRKADLDKSRCKDVIQRLEMRLYWQSKTFAQDMQAGLR